MTSDNEALLAAFDDEQLLAQIKGAYLEGVGKGKLSLTDRRVQFEHRRGLLSAPQVEFSVDLSHVFSARVREESSTVTLEWLDDAGTPVVRELTLPEGNAAERLRRLLNKRLRALREDADFRERSSLYQSFLWMAAYHTWLAAQLLARIVEGLIEQDWDAVEAASAEIRNIAGSLPGSTAPEFDQGLDDLARDVVSRDASLVLRDVVAMHRVIGQSLNSQESPDDKWANMPISPSGGLMWQHIRYIFLFTAWHSLLTNRRRSGEETSLEESSRVAPILSILADGVSRELQPDSRAGGQHSPGDPDHIDSAARNLEALLKINAGIV